MMKCLKEINCLHLTSRQVVSIVLLAGALDIIFGFWMGYAEYSPSGASAICWGFPFEAIKVKIAESGFYNRITVDNYYWNGIVMNIAIYTVISIIVVKLAIWVYDQVEYRGYYKT